ncbi:hypothetical protein C2845_PM01G18290 [Panicum miliaceum]|uniref:KIB1-4 beta-propeller domain-containing protein n=1 Tax=Panicum miliaceum TaxID=4540 RepID=A0A3L6TEG7_PANMI|nr:hypothetical protein C2845_PM01G18290 [Panicum miliaceum]
MADYVRFRAVCRPWRRCCTDPHMRAVLEDSRLHPRRWVMLLGEGEKLTAAGSPHCTCRRFLNVSTGQCVQVEIPELRDHGVLRTSTEDLLLVAKGATGAVRLLNPLTRQAAELPPITGLDFTQATSARVLLYDYEKEEGSILAFAKPGDERWVLVKATNDLLMPTMSFAGRFYGVTLDSVMVADTTARREDAKLAVAARLATPIRELMSDTAHLVEIAGELMLVHRRMRRVRGASGEYNDFKETYKLYRVNLATGKATPAAARGRAIFVGRCRSLAVSAQVFPSLSTNTVYNFDVAGSGWQISTYHLRGGSTGTFNCHESGPLAHPCSEHRIVDDLPPGINMEILVHNFLSRNRIRAVLPTDEQREEKNRKRRETYKRNKCHANNKENMPEYGAPITLAPAIVDHPAGCTLRAGLQCAPRGIPDILAAHLKSVDCILMLEVEPKLSIPMGPAITVSVLAHRKDSNKMACIINKSTFDYIDSNAARALAYEYLRFSPRHPFISDIRAWMSLLFLYKGANVIEVFGIELDFCDAARSETEILWLLDMLDWK